jgi:hypothetical protein
MAMEHGYLISQYPSPAHVIDIVLEYCFGYQSTMARHACAMTASKSAYGLV